MAAPLTFRAGGALSGTARVPGDKSISHRALMLAALAIGESRIDGLLEGADVLATAAAMRAMGAAIERAPDGGWRVRGVGVGGLLQPAAALDMGNSATAARLLIGLVASHAITATFVGDASLSRRPMARVIEPLARMGAEVVASPGDRLPLMVRGVTPAIPIVHRLEVASAQVKSAVLFAGLNTPGVTRVVEPTPTRDHSECLFRLFGADLAIEDEPDGARSIAIRGETDLVPRAVAVPGDPSSAAFLAVAATIVAGSALTIAGIGLNPTRRGLYDMLAAMGSDIAFADPREASGEPVADIVVRSAPLVGIEVPPEIAPSMIDEYPIFFVAAALASGRTIARGLGELRHKECDRVATMAEGLRAIGARVEEFEDGLAIEGSGGEPLAGGATIASRLDHRVAMSFAVASLACRRPVTVDDATPIATSFPGFAGTMLALGVERVERMAA